MDPNDNIYTPTLACQEVEIIVQDQGFPMHEDPTPLLMT